MPGKFINEITGDTPAKDDLAVFFDKSKNSTAQATIAEMVNAGLDLAAGAKGQVPTIDVKVDAATSSLVNILTWGAGGGVDFKGTPTRPPTGTDEILTNDPANGLIGKTTLQQLVVAGGATILQPGTAVNTALVWNDTAGKWEPARAVSEAKNINGGATGELPFQLNTHVTAWIPLGNAGQVLTIGDIGTAGNSFIAPMWNDPVKELPTLPTGGNKEYLLHCVTQAGKASSLMWRELINRAPSLELPFAISRSILPIDGPGIKFTRASSGSYFDQNGILKFSGSNSPRLTHFFNDSNWESYGLILESQRTNFILQSEALDTLPWSKTDYVLTMVTSPSGENNAFKLVAPATNAIRRIEQTVTPSSSGILSFSFYAKAAGWDFIQFSSGWNNEYVNFDLVGKTSFANGATVAYMTDLGDGWVRCSANFNATNTPQGVRLVPLQSDVRSRFPNTTGNGTDGVSVYGVQVEVGTGAPTSYIKTTNSAVTRSGDVCAIDGANFSSLWNPLEGTIVVEYSRRAPNSNTPVVSIDSSAGNYIAINSTGGVQSATVFSGGVQQVSIGLGSYPSANKKTKIAFSWKENDFAASRDGGAVATGSTGLIPTGLTAMHIGGDFSGTSFLDGTISRLRYFPQRIPNDYLASLSR